MVLLIFHVVAAAPNVEVVAIGSVKQGTQELAQCWNEDGLRVSLPLRRSWAALPLAQKRASLRGDFLRAARLRKVGNVRQNFAYIEEGMGWAVAAIFLPQGWGGAGMRRSERGIISLFNAHGDAIAALLTDGVEEVVDNFACVFISRNHFRHSLCTDRVAVAVCVDVLLQGGMAVSGFGVVDAGAVLEAAIWQGWPQRASLA